MLAPAAIEGVVELCAGLLEHLDEGARTLRLVKRGEDRALRHRPAHAALVQIEAAAGARVEHREAGERPPLHRLGRAPLDQRREALLDPVPQHAGEHRTGPPPGTTAPVPLVRALGYGEPVTRVVELPDRGRLIVGTDFQGNVDDFERLAEHFVRAHEEHPDGAHLVVTGDLVHGPEIPEPHWPEYLGTFFHADSAAVLERAESLETRFPGRVHLLLGNHEHAHIGGPVVSKFFANEALRLEKLMGPARTERVRAWFARWPLVAYARSAGLLMVHGAPNAAIRSVRDIEDVSLEGRGDGSLDEIAAELLWARTASTVRARAFLRAIHPALKVAIYGHDVAREGYAIDREPLLCLSTSFGCHDGDKLYLDWDLASPAESAAMVADVGLRALRPEAPPVYRKPTSNAS